MNGNSKSGLFFGFAGLICIAAGLFFNQWIVASFFSFRRDLSNSFKVLLLAFDTVAVTGGFLLVYWRNKIQISKTNLALSGITLIVLFTLAEVSSRVLDVYTGYNFLYNKTRAERPIIPFRMFGLDLYVQKDETTYIKSRHNELYPLGKPAGTYRIVAIGGSTTQNLADGEHYPKVLEKMLQEKYPARKIEVINVGNSGYSTAQMIILLSLDVLSWNPDAIIVSENINDLLASYFPGFTFDYSNKYSTASFLPFPSRVQMLLGWSRFYWILASRLDALRYRLDDMRATVYRRKSYGEEPPREGQRVFERNLKTITSIARSNNIEVIFGTQPLERSEEYWDRHMRYKKYNDIAIYPLHGEFILHHAVFNAIIKKVAAETGVALVDNDTVFGGDPSFFIDFVHYNNVGVHKIAEDYFTLIVNKNLINNRK